MIGLALQPARIKASVVEPAASLFFMDSLAVLAELFFHGQPWQSVLRESDGRTTQVRPSRISTQLGKFATTPAARLSED